jgi:hypothetical protein
LVGMLVMLVGCTEPEPTFEEVENIGGLCVVGDGDAANTSYVENAAVEIRVVLDTCASCRASDITASCSIERDGSTLSVTASVSYWEQPTDVCPAHCTKLLATCTSEPLAAGVYTVEYAGETTGFTVPSVGPAAQLGEGQQITSECGT